MAKYSAEFKFEVVQEYLNGHIGYTDLTKKYDIRGCGQKVGLSLCDNS